MAATWTQFFLIPLELAFQCLHFLLSSVFAKFTLSFLRANVGCCCCCCCSSLGLSRFDPLFHFPAGIRGCSRSKAHGQPSAEFKWLRLSAAVIHHHQRFAAAGLLVLFFYLRSSLSLLLLEIHTTIISSYYSRVLDTIHHHQRFACRWSLVLFFYLRSSLSLLLLEIHTTIISSYYSLVFLILAIGSVNPPSTSVSRSS